MKCLLLSVSMVLSLVTGASAQDWAKQKLEKSSRHQEWVDVKHDGRTVHAFVVYPEVKGKALAVIVIHENMGLTDWVRDAADQFAEAGYIAIAPDLLSGSGPNGGKTSDFPDTNAARDAIYKLPADQVTADLNAVADYVKKLPAASGKIAVAGFCWGGGQTFRMATNRPDLSAAFVFYGPGPDSTEAVARVHAAVYGFYGGSDERIDATIPKTEEMMKAAGKKYQPVIYEGAGHGFMRAGEDPAGTEPNRKARDQSWTRLKEILKGL